MLLPCDGKPGKQRHHGNQARAGPYREPAREARKEEEALRAGPLGPSPEN